MDRLGMCMDELRILARSNDPDRAVLVEAYSTPILLPRQSVCGKPWSASAKVSATSKLKGVRARIGA